MFIADDHEYTRARMAEIDSEKSRCFSDTELQTAVENYLGAEASEECEHQMLTLDWGIYAQVYLAKA